MSEQPKRNKQGFYPCPDGVDRVSVTTILQAINKPFLIPWAAKEEREMVLNVAIKHRDGYHGTQEQFKAALLEELGKEKAHAKLLKAAGDIGTELHARAEREFRKELGVPVGPEPPLSPEAATAFAHFEAWRAESQFKPLMVEKMVWSKKHGVAGTLDIFGSIHDAFLVVTDMKTSAGYYLEHALQVSAYRAALIEMGEADESIGGLIVHLPKTAGTEPKKPLTISPEEMDSHFKTFLAAKEIWTAQRAWENRQNA